MTVPPVRRRRRRRRPIRWLLLVLALVGVFGLGVALGEALHDNPKPGGGQTIVRTLNPVALAPSSETNDTTTVSKP